MKAAKPKRRIVPQQISSPTGISKHKVDALSGNFKIGDLKEQERLGKELLGAGRKLHVTLVPFQKEQKQVNWKKVSRQCFQPCCILVVLIKMSIYLDL